MDVVKKYNIAWKGLAPGTHHYDLEVDDRFFAAFENSEIKGGNAAVAVDVEKAPNALNLVFNIKGAVTVECDRCLEDCTLPVEYTGQLAVKFSEAEITPGEEYDGEVLWLRPTDGEVNIAQYIYESIVLALPYQRVHGMDAEGKSLCNPEMLDRFLIVSQEEFDKIAGEEDEVKMEDDPQWEKLRKLKESM